MTEEQIALARRAVACRHFRWLPGMRRLTFDAGHLYPSRVADDGTYPGGLFPIPDLTDPATLGCLLALVREAYGKPLSFCRYVEGNPPFWHINTGHTGDTEAEALVAALEAAP